VVVVGAGPAGALAALGLARQGVPVLLVERRRFPRWKVCGACLSGQALAALEQAGQGPLLDQLGARPLRSVQLGLQGPGRSWPYRPGGWCRGWRWIRGWWLLP
jgi:2-polyprenyl-6-methoxyphenol hydroxylase-like FAD-dependent oxidoreductase